MSEPKFNCKKTLQCERCGDCCHIRQSELIDLTDEEDYKIRKKLYETKGIIYIFPLKHYTISLTKEEKQTLEAEARKLKLKLKISPKKITINVSKTKVEAIDYFLDHDVCPFLKDKNVCVIYNSRPQVCRIFPHIIKQDIINPSALIEKSSDFDYILKKVKQLLKKQQ